MQIPAEHEPLIEVIRRVLRWEVAIDGETETLLDWFFSRDRAITHALENGRVLGASRVRIRHPDGTLTWLATDIVGPLPQAA